MGLSHQSRGHPQSRQTITFWRQSARVIDQEHTARAIPSIGITLALFRASYLPATRHYA
jgi:hypothetical protein